MVPKKQFTPVWVSLDSRVSCFRRLLSLFGERFEKCRVVATAVETHRSAAEWVAQIREVLEGLMHCWYWGFVGHKRHTTASSFKMLTVNFNGRVDSVTFKCSQPCTPLNPHPSWVQSCDSSFFFFFFSSNAFGAERSAVSVSVKVQCAGIKSTLILCSMCKNTFSDHKCDWTVILYGWTKHLTDFSDVCELYSTLYWCFACFYHSYLFLEKNFNISHKKLNHAFTIWKENIG